MNAPELLIVGQGLAGTALAWKAHQRGIRFEIWDQGNEERSASLAAGGVFGPITGQNLTILWRVQDFLPKAEKFYQDVQVRTGARFFYQLPIAHAFTTPNHNSELDRRSHELSLIDPEIRVRPKLDFPEGLSAPHGGFETERSGYLDCKTYLLSSRLYFQKIGSFFIRSFDAETEAKHSFRWIVLATGEAIRERPEFSRAKFSCTLGESVVAKIPELSRSHIWKKKLACVPLPNGEFRVGSTYNREESWRAPSVEGIAQLEIDMRAWMPGIEFQIQKEQARSGLRTHRQGHLPLLARADGKRLAAFAGLGSKGVLWAPHASGLLLEHLFGDATLPSELTF